MRKLIATSIAAVLYLISLPVVSAQRGGSSSFTPRFNSMNSNVSNGRCKLRIRVDEEVDVVMSGDRVSLRTIRGRPAYDIGSECTSPLPRGGIRDFEFQQTDGRGPARLVQQPSGRFSEVVINVSDPPPGDAKYTLEFRWRTGGGNWNDGWNGGGRPPEPPPIRPGDGGWQIDEAIRACQAAVQDQIRSRYGFNDVNFNRINIDDRPGRRDWIVGDAVGRRRNERARFPFNCGVDFRGGRLRSVDVVRQ